MFCRGFIKIWQTEERAHRQGTLEISTSKLLDLFDFSPI